MKDIALDICQGSTFKRVITISDENGDAVDLSGRTFRGQIRKNFGDFPLVGEFDFNIEDQIVDKGKVTMILPASELTSLVLTEKVCYRYDVEMVNLSEVTRILQGTANIYPEITK